MVHWLCARFVYQYFSRESSVTRMLTRLQWDTLAHRRAKANVTMLCRVVNQLVAIPVEQYLRLSATNTRGHDQMLFIGYCRTNTMQFSFFFPDAARQCNQLPSSSTVSPVPWSFPPKSRGPSTAIRHFVYILYIVSAPFFTHCTHCAGTHPSHTVTACAKYNFNVGLHNTRKKKKNEWSTKKWLWFSSRRRPMFQETGSERKWPTGKVDVKVKFYLYLIISFGQQAIKAL